jgi:toxin ParE1/3/4
MVEIKQVIVTHFAKDDLNEIAEYYYSLSPSYVEKTVRQFEENVMSLKQNPLRGRVVPELEKFGYTRYREIIQGNYRIVYEVSNDTVIVHVIIDGRRDFESLIFSKLARFYDSI